MRHPFHVFRGTRHGVQSAGVLPPCGHACQATVLLDEGLQSQASSCCLALPSGSLALSDQLEGNCSGAQPHVPAELSSAPHDLLHSDLQGQPTPSPRTQPGATTWQKAHAGETMDRACLAARDEAQKAAAHQQELQAAAVNELLYCGAGLLNAYLAVTFDQLLLLSKGRAVDLVQSGASDPGNFSCTMLDIHEAL